MATQKRPLPSNIIARAEINRTIEDIYSEEYVTQAFEGFPDPGDLPNPVGADEGQAWVADGADGAYWKTQRHSNTWTIDPNGSGDFLTGDALMTSPLVLDHDRVNISYGATFTTYTKVLHLYLYNTSYLRLPSTINVDLYVTGAEQNFNGESTGGYTEPLSGIIVYPTITVNGNVYLSNVILRPLPGDPSTRSLYIYGNADIRNVTSAHSIRYYGTGYFNARNLYSSANIIGDATGSGTMTLINVRCGAITRSGGTGTTMQNVEASSGVINFTGANSHTYVYMRRVDCGTTLTLPVVASGITMKYVTATTLTAPSAITAVTSQYGIFGAKTNVTFANAGLNIVGTTLT